MHSSHLSSITPEEADSCQRVDLCPSTNCHAHEGWERAREQANLKKGRREDVFVDNKRKKKLTLINLYEAERDVRSAT